MLVGLCNGITDLERWINSVYVLLPSTTALCLPETIIYLTPLIYYLNQMYLSVPQHATSCLRQLRKLASISKKHESTNCLTVAVVTKYALA